MRKKTAAFAAAVVIVLTAVVVFLEGRGALTPPAQDSEGRRYVRIVSLAPSITETLFALGLGDKVVGVTRFCRYPPEAARKTHVGGFLDPNYEVLASLEPDLVFLLPEHENVRAYLDELGVRYEIVHNRSVAEILGTITAIGSYMDCENRADSLVADITARIDAIRFRLQNGKKHRESVPSVLVSVERSAGAGIIQDVYAAGAGTIYDELVTLAGGKNVCGSLNVTYPTLSAEGIITLNPEIIIDLIPRADDVPVDNTIISSDWQSLSLVFAVRSGQVYIVDDDYAFVPGPRFIRFLEDISAMIAGTGG
jgi:iron complex transport system substrate-binding protein